MYIDKSFQLLSADSSKLTSDETRRQTVGDDKAEFSQFSEFFGTELGSREPRQNGGKDKAAVGKDKNSGQEFAASLAKPDMPVEADATKAIDQALSGKAELDVESTADDTDRLVKSSTEKVFEQLQSVAIESLQPKTEAEPEADVAVSPNPWLSIISQSLDFNSMLSQTSSNGAASETLTDGKLISAETLDENVLGLTQKEPSDVEISSSTTLQLNKTEVSEPSVVLGQQLLKGQDVVSKEQSKKALTEAAALVMARESQDARSQTVELTKADAGPDEKQIGKSGKLTAEQVSVPDRLKTDKVIQQATVEGAVKSESKGAETQILTQSDIQSAGTLAATATVAATSAAEPTLQMVVPADVVAGQVNLAPRKEELSTDAVINDLELPNAGATPAKNEPQSFAQFQKAANAAAALIQKQQLQAEQTQGQPSQVLAAQHPQKLSELEAAIPSQHSDSQIVMTTLAQTERQVVMNAGMSASSGGQQQQQAASQLFAARLHEQVSREQPALNLLEPNAATQLKERVMFQVNQKVHSAEIKLAPEELGTMQIKVQLQQDQLSVQFIVQHAGAKEALEQQMPRLREMLQEQGIELTEGQVSQQREGSDSQGEARERKPGVGHGSIAEDEPMLQQAMIKVSDRMVDYYA